MKNHFRFTLVYAKTDNLCNTVAVIGKKRDVQKNYSVFKSHRKGKFIDDDEKTEEEIEFEVWKKNKKKSNKQGNKAKKL